MTNDKCYQTMIDSNWARDMVNNSSWLVTVMDHCRYWLCPKMLLMIVRTKCGINNNHYWWWILIKFTNIDQNDDDWMGTTMTTSGYLATIRVSNTISKIGCILAEIWLEFKHWYFVDWNIYFPRSTRKKQNIRNVLSCKSVRVK